MAGRRFGLQVQFVGLIVGLLSLVFLVITVSVVRQATSSYKDRLQKEAQAFATLATEPIGESYVRYRDSGRVRIQQQVDKLTELDSSVVNVKVIDVEGQVQFEQNQQPKFDISREEASSFENIYGYDKDGYLNKVVVPYIEDFGGHRYSVAYSISASSFKNSARTLATSIITFSFSMLLVSAGVIYLAVYRLFLRPLRQISQTALTISQGQWDEKISLARQDELQDMADSINTMAAALKADIEKLKSIDIAKTEFMMIASHNLRTPLTILNGYLDLLKQESLDEKTQAMIMPMYASTKRLANFAEDMLVVARIETGDKHVLGEFKDAVVTDLLEELIEEFRPLCDEKGVVFEGQLPDEPVTMRMSRSYLRNAIWNLLDNALKFTHADGKIALRVEKTDDKLVITVKDTGIGISEEEKSKIFTKFHRATSVSRYDYEGTGIGLYVTKLVIEEHGGTVTFESKLTEGSTFTISLPLNF